MGVMRVVFTPLAVLMALAACEEAAPPKLTMPSIPPAESEPATPASGPGTTAAGGEAPSLPTGGSGGAPLPEAANNIVFKILAGFGPTRSGSIVALPPIHHRDRPPRRITHRGADLATSVPHARMVSTIDRIGTSQTVDRAREHRHPRGHVDRRTRRLADHRHRGRTVSPAPTASFVASTNP